MGMTPVFVLPNPADKRFAPVSQALRSFAEERGIQYEVPRYEEKDPLHLTRQSAQDIAKRYPGAFVGGDSNSVRIAQWGYGQKLRDPNTFVDPTTGLIMGRVGAPSADLAKWITQYRKTLESGRFAGGRTGYQSRGRVIPEMENPSEALEMGGMRPVGPTLNDSYAIPAPDQEVARPGVSAAPALTPAQQRRRAESEMARTVPKEEWPAHQWVEKMYGSYPEFPYSRTRQFGMPLAVDEKGQATAFATTMLVPKRPNTVYIDWLQAYPQRQGYGSQALKTIMDSARENNIRLELTPWDKGQVPKSGLERFYKRAGFQKDKFSTKMYFDPNEDGKERGGSVVDAALMVLSKQAKSLRGRPD